MYFVDKIDGHPLAVSLIALGISIAALALALGSIRRNREVRYVVCVKRHLNGRWERVSDEVSSKREAREISQNYRPTVAAVTIRPIAREWKRK